jgi:hypothetical protein
LDTGTGHGSVTLHLARSIQAANAPFPSDDIHLASSSGRVAPEKVARDNATPDEDSIRHWEDWRRSRRAIVHSVEVSPAYSKHAQKKVVSGFRRGLYSPHIDFHVANVTDWIDAQLEQRRREPFLSYVFLDMPSCHRYLGQITAAMKENALIAVFVPSITQIGECVREIKANGLPLRMEKSLELGDGISNGRLWDVRLAFKKTRDPIEEAISADRSEIDAAASPEELGEPASESSPSDSSEDEAFRAKEKQEISAVNTIRNDEPVMVCRPKVGERVIGGGFVGLWRRAASEE